MSAFHIFCTCGPDGATVKRPASKVSKHNRKPWSLSKQNRQARFNRCGHCWKLWPALPKTKARA